MDRLQRMLHEVVAELGLTRPRDASGETSSEPNAARSRSWLELEARRFLRELDPDSQEGLWFDAVAEAYPSRLEAAIAYVREVGPSRTLPDR